MMMADARRKVTGSAGWFLNWAGPGSVIVNNELPGRTEENTPVCPFHAGGWAR